MASRFMLRGEISFEADSVESALEKLAAHFIWLALVRRWDSRRDDPPRPLTEYEGTLWIQYDDFSKDLHYGGGR